MAGVLPFDGGGNEFVSWQVAYFFDGGGNEHL